VISDSCGHKYPEKGLLQVLKQKKEFIEIISIKRASWKYARHVAPAKNQIRFWGSLKFEGKIETTISVLKVAI
jgi:hypothetical protein